ncbi:MAG TPA: ankyrin repeat domain-containing protein, partial [Flavobacterium sp.]|nr:ankyrin repeat domain-containing protein [Flavobacterium sp.]
LAKGVDANKADNQGNTPLMIAAARETAVLELLLPITKNSNLQNNKGESALTMAVKSGTPEAVVLLLNQKATINVQDKDGNNLAFYLIQSYKPLTNPEAANASEQDPFTAKTKLLQDKGLNLATPQKDGNTLYHLAIAKNDVALLKKIT